jgi:hypothetical protein
MVAMRSALPVSNHQEETDASAIVNLGSARIELGVELKPPEHEIHQVRPTLKHHIARQGTNIIEKGLASHQHLAKQRILAIAPLQDRMEEKR